MSDTPRPRAVGSLLLAALSLLVTAAILVVVLVPISTCTPCAILTAYLEAMVIDEQVIVTGGKVVHAPSKARFVRPDFVCSECDGRGRLTLLRKWILMWRR